MQPSGTIKIPNIIIFEELEERTARGEATIMPFAGKSMEPTLHDGKINIRLVPIDAATHPNKGDIVLFRYNGQHLLHRIVKIEDDTYTMRGDACASCEVVKSGALVALLDSVIYHNGKTIKCNSWRWRARTSSILAWKKLRRALSWTFGRRRRRWQAPLYLSLLLLLMWAPVGRLGIPLNNFVLGIRVDHLLHASVYLPAAWYIGHWCRDRLGLTLAAAILLALTTEGIQYLLPYRGFDINDLLSNVLGIFIGWIAAYFKKKSYL